MGAANHIVISALVTGLISLNVVAQTKEHTPEKLGTVNFPISCKTDVKPDFIRAVSLLHSFAYGEAVTAFKDIAKKDPKCAIAQWGIAMSNFHIIWAPPTDEEFKEGKAAAQKAAALGSINPKEQDFISAIGAYYNTEGSHPERVVAYEKAMAKVAERNPNDHEAQIFYALSILGVAYNSPPDKTYKLQKQAADILNKLLPTEPDHPGVAHYLIHAYDYPELANLGLSAARAFAKIAPSVPHALHMPSHIFVRLGLWQEAIDSDLASAKVAQELTHRSMPGATSFDALHAWDYLVYAYLQTGQDTKAKQIVQSVSKIRKLDANQFSAGYAMAAIPTRYALERHAWKEAANLKLKQPFFPWSKYPYAEAIIHFGRSIGNSRIGNIKPAQEALAKLTAIKKDLEGKKGFDWATQVEIQRLAASGWLTYAKKNNTEALALLRSAADLEDTTDKHPVTPGAILPAREQLADLLLLLKQPTAALKEYETSLKLAQGRLNSYKGAAQAAEAAGLKDKAKEFNDKLNKLNGGKISLNE